MTDRLSLHQKRLLLRYLRLLARFRTAPVMSSLGEISEIIYCSLRYTRSQLNDMQQSGWLYWTPRAGRGAGGVIHCRLDEAALQALLDGDFKVQTEDFGLPDSLASVKATDGDRYCIRFFRPLMKVTPSLYTAWPERHLIHMVHVGLMRLEPTQEAPVPGLAHTVDVSSDGLTWTLHLRRGLTWHNGKPFKPEQLLPTLERHIGSPGLPYVEQIGLSGYTLTFRLTTPDILLPVRLAHPAYALPHPEDEIIGLGPFRVSEHTASSLVLQRSPFWYGENPYAAEVRFDIQPRPAPDWSVIKLETLPSPAAPEPVSTWTGLGGYTFMTFNANRGTLTHAQQPLIRHLVKSLVQSMLNNNPTIKECPEWLQGGDSDVEPAELPAELSVVYCLMPETTLLMEQLKKSLLWRRCRLNITTRAANHWLLPGEEWSAFDFCVGFQPIGTHQAGRLEEHYRHCPMFREFWGSNNDKRGQRILKKILKGTYSQYSRWIQRLNTYLIKRGWITPLYAQGWCLQAPARVKGVETRELGWPDFTRLWLP